MNLKDKVTKFRNHLRNQKKNQELLMRRKKLSKESILFSNKDFFNLLTLLTKTKDDSINDLKNIKALRFMTMSHNFKLDSANSGF